MLSEIEHWVGVVCRVIVVVVIVVCGYKLYGERIKKWLKRSS